MTTTETRCEGVTEQEVQALKAAGWFEATMELGGMDVRPFYALGFDRGSLCLYQHRDLWVLSTRDCVIARLKGPVTACAEIAKRILHLADWSAVDEAAERGVPPPDDLQKKVYDTLLEGLELAPMVTVQPPKRRNRRARDV
jgi:hypothetical protein